MGKLLMMPLKANVMSQDEPAVTETGTPDFTVWLNAPRERTPRYFPVYVTLSKAMQASLRTWTQQWLRDNPQVFEKRIAAYSLLVFGCTRPFSGRPSHLFTYDIQQTATLDQAFRTAGRMLRQQLDELNTAHRAAGLPGVMSLIPKKVEEFVNKNRRPIYRMFSVETMLMNELLKFTQINIPKFGLERAVDELRGAFRKHLHRFTEEFDMAERTEELLSILTGVLLETERDGAALRPAA